MKNTNIFSSISEYENAKSGGILNVPNISFINEDSGIRYLLKFDFTHNGHEYVDLGLPSGTKWATMNVGASSETDYGNYYGYGKGATQYSETNGDIMYRGTENPLDSSVDTATQVWGGSWHMPTLRQISELVDNTTFKYVTNYKGSGINGSTFTAANGAVLFVPAAGEISAGRPSSIGTSGYYWSSTPEDSSYAFQFSFGDNAGGSNDEERNIGCPVRPVFG